MSAAESCEKCPDRFVLQIYRRKEICLTLARFRNYPQTSFPPAALIIPLQTNVGWHTFLEANCCYYFVIKTIFCSNIFSPRRPTQRHAGQEVRQDINCRSCRCGGYNGPLLQSNESPQRLLSNRFILYKTLKLKAMVSHAMIMSALELQRLIDL